MKQDKRAKAVKLEKKQSNIKINSKQVKNATKKVGFFSLLFIALILLVGFVMGFVTSQKLFASDCFEMNKFSNQNIDVSIGIEGDFVEYSEMGAKCVMFGKEYKVDIEYFYREDISYDEIKVENVDSKKQGIFYAVYTTSAKKYSGIKLIRTIYVFGEEDNG